MPRKPDLGASQTTVQGPLQLSRGTSAAETKARIMSDLIDTLALQLSRGTSAAETRGSNGRLPLDPWLQLSRGTSAAETSSCSARIQIDLGCFN